MGEKIRDTVPITFARGEEVVKRVDYLNVNGKKFHQDASLVLTNKRLVHVMFEKINHVEGTYLEEVPVEDIDSIDYNIHNARNGISIVALIIAFLFLVVSVVSFILSSSKTLKQMVYIGIGALVISLLIVLLAILLRKWTTEFHLKVYSHKFKQDHLGISNVKAVETQVAEEKANKRVAIRVFFVIFDFILLSGAAALLVLFIMNLTGGSKGGSTSANSVFMTYGLPLIVVIVFIFIYNFVMSVVLKRTAKAKKMKIAIDISGKGKSVPRVAINTSAVDEFLNQCGALVLSLKESNKGE